MSSLMYILKRSFINEMKGLKKRKAALIGYILLFAFVILILVSSFLMPSGIITQQENDLFIGIIAAILLFYAFYSFQSAIEKGSSFFRASDVNMAFNAPIKTGDLLIYGFIKSLASVLTVVFVAFCQIPNLKNNFAIQNSGIFFLVAGFLLYLISMPILGMMIYSFASRSEKNKDLCKRILYAVMVLITAYALFCLVKEGKVSALFSKGLAHPVFRYIPIMGWALQVISTAVLGVSGMTYVYLALLVLTVIVSLKLLYSMDQDFYEDVLLATQYNEELIQARRQNRMGETRGKLKKIDYTFRKEGAKVIYEKSILDRRKKGFFFLDITSLSTIGVTLAVTFFSGMQSIYYPLFFGVYMMTVFAANDRWSRELGNHYIYLIPESDYKKLFYATLGEHFKNLTDAVILFAIAGFLLKADFQIVIAAIFCYVSFGAMNLYYEVLSRKVFGNKHSSGLKMLRRLLMLFIAFLPGIIILVYVSITTGSSLLGMLCIILWNLLVSALFFYFGGKIFREIELD